MTGLDSRSVSPTRCVERVRKSSRSCHVNQDATLIKQRLVNHYDKDAKDYHAFHYARWGEGYSPLQFRQRYIEAMIQSAGLPKGAKILDVGCGPGELLSALVGEGHDVW